jgi:putative hydrolase of the HAD superfamily
MDPIVRMIRRNSRFLRPPPARRCAAKTSGSLPRQPRAILFDVYETLLVRTGPRWPDPASEELSSALAQAIAAEHASQLAGGVLHPEVLIEAIWARLLPGREEQEYRFLAASWESRTRPVIPAPGCRALLRKLRRMNLALGLVSNAQFYTPLVFEALLGGRPEQIGFSPSLCIYSFQHGVAKPARELFELAAQGLAAMGIGRNETVMVGNDLADDISPAAACGFMTVRIGRTRGCGDPPGGDTGGADAAIARLTDLDGLLGGCRR